MTRYFVTVKFHRTGNVHTIGADSATERALTIISLCAYADVLREWVERS